MRALIDATIHDTPIGQCVVVGPCDGSSSCPAAVHIEGCFNGPPPNRNVSAGDVLAAVETLDGSCSECGRKRTSWDSECRCGIHAGGLRPTTGYVRRGFVRVVEVLPVVNSHTFALDNQGWIRYYHVKSGPIPHRTVPAAPLDLPVSPGDVVLVVAPWCETCGLVAGCRVQMSKPGAWAGTERCGRGFVGGTCYMHGWVRPCPNCASTPVRRVDGGSGPGVGEVAP